jgi:hypothetical protein
MLNDDAEAHPELARDESLSFLAGAALTVIMKTALEYVQPLVPDCIDDPVLIVDPAAPAAGIIALKRFRFPDAFERGTK